MAVKGLPDALLGFVVGGGGRRRREDAAEGEHEPQDARQAEHPTTIDVLGGLRGRP